MSGLAGAYSAVITRVEAATDLTLSRSIIAKDRPAVADMRRKFSVLMPSGTASIDRGPFFRVPQRVEVWFVYPVRGGKQDHSMAEALKVEQRIINALDADRNWQDPPVDECFYQSVTRQVSADGELIKIGISFEMVVIWSGTEVVP